MSKAARQVADSLQKKGFQERQGDHAFYHLFVDGKKTVVSTKISHGEKDIGDKLLGMMARQVRLTRKQFGELVDCPMSAEEYVAILRKSGVVGS